MLVETDGGLIPFEHLPFESLGIHFHGPASDGMKQGFAHTASPPSLGHHQIFQIPRAPLPSAVSSVMKCHPYNAIFVRLRKRHFKTPLIRIAHQLIQCQGHLIGRVFVNGQFDNEVSNRVQVLGLGGANRASEWL